MAEINKINRPDPSAPSGLEWRRAMETELSYWCGLVNASSGMGITFVVRSKPWGAEDHKYLVDRVNARVCGKGNIPGARSAILQYMQARHLDRVEGGIELFFPSSSAAADAAFHQPAIATIKHAVDLFRYTPGLADTTSGGDIRHIRAGIGCPRNAMLRLYQLLEEEYRGRIKIVCTTGFPEEDDPIWEGTTGFWV